MTSRNAAFAAALCCLAAASPVMAQQQQGWITVSEPGEWGENGIVNVPIGTRIRVVGQAFHRAGVRAVRIGDQETTLRPAPGGVVDFEGALLTTSGMRELTITVQPAQGEPIRRTFRLNVPVQEAALPPQQPPTSSQVIPVKRTPATGSTVATSLLLPGLGQFRTKRPLLGAAFLASAGAALGVGIGATEKEVKCRSGLVNGACPEAEVASETVKRPLLIPGAAGFLVLGLASGFEAASYLKRREGAAPRSGLEAALDPGSQRIVIRLTLPTSRAQEAP